MINYLKRLTRWKEWYSSKIPPLFIGFYSWVLLSDQSPIEAIPKILISTIFAICYLSFGYAINNYSDREVDKKANKPNIMNEITQRKAIIWLLIIGISCLGVLFPFFQDKNVIYVGISSYILAITYSMPPVRFKEQGIAGIIIASVAQRSIPLLLAMVIFNDFHFSMWLLNILFFLIGIRYMLIHQLIDLPNDKQTQISTFTLRQGHDVIVNIIKYVIFPLEVICVLIWFIFIGQQIPIIWFVPIIYGIWLFICWISWIGIEPVLTWIDYEHPPLGDFYIFYWPICLGIIITYKNPSYVILIILQLIWQYHYFIKQKTIFKRVFQIRKNIVKLKNQHLG